MIYVRVERAGQEVRFVSGREGGSKVGKVVVVKLKEAEERKRLKGLYRKVLTPRGAPRSARRGLIQFDLGNVYLCGLFSIHLPFASLPFL